MSPRFALACLLAVAAAAGPTMPAARAAESYDSCRGTITSLPTTITTQGTWCLKGDLATALDSGVIITVATSNVTIDCNGFKIGNLAAGEDTQTTGIHADGTANLTVRGCTLRGFGAGVQVSGYGHILEDNRIESSRGWAVILSGDGHVVRRNLITDTGGQFVQTMAVHAEGTFDIVDNIVDGVYAFDDGGTHLVYGIYVAGPSQFTIRGNVIRGLTTYREEGLARGIGLWSGEGDVIDNAIAAEGPGDPSAAVFCLTDDGFIRDNRATGFTAFSAFCPAGSGNELRN